MAEQKPEIKNQTSGSLPAQDEAEEFLFYNVMPKDKKQGKMLAPSLSITQTPSAPEPNAPAAAPSFFNAHKKLILLGGGGIILVALGAFVYFVWFNKPALDPNVDLLNAKFSHVGKKVDPTKISIPSDWIQKSFPGCTDEKLCGDAADPDKDGLSNVEEYQAKTDPNNNDSDKDGIADGDEVHVFQSDPLKDHSGPNDKYSDADNLKGGYNLTKGGKFTEQELAAIKDRLDQFDLHEPTVSTFGDTLKTLYHFGEPKAATATSTPDTLQNASSTPSNSAEIDNSPEAKQDRDAMRANTIKIIGVALAKYHDDKKSYPATSNFAEMASAVRPYIKVATNSVDPINKSPYIYTYTLSSDGKDYTLTYFSENLTTIIKKHAADGLKDRSAEEAGVTDEQRKNDLESIKVALLIYSSKNASPNQDFIFPSAEKYKSELLTNGYIDSFPTDPRTGLDYEYKVSDKFNTFTLKAKLDNPPAGTTGWMCNQDGCDYY